MLRLHAQENVKQSSASLRAGGMARLHGFGLFPKEQSGAQAGQQKLRRAMLMVYVQNSSIQELFITAPVIVKPQGHIVKKAPPAALFIASIGMLVATFPHILPRQEVVKAQLGGFREGTPTRGLPKRRHTRCSHSSASSAL